MVTSISSLQIRDDVRVTIAGTIVTIREDEFLLRDATGRVGVDAEEQLNFRSLNVGDRVTITGEFEDGEFDAVSIVDAPRLDR